MDSFERSNPASRIAGFAAVLVFHAVLIYALANGLGAKAVKLITQPIQTRLITDLPPPPPPPQPPPPPPLALPPPPFVPLPEIHTEVPPPKAITVPPSPKPPPRQEFAPSGPPTAVSPTSTAPVAPAAPAAVARTGPTKIASASCDAPEKPDISDRIGEKGTVVIAVTIGTDGRVTQSSVANSSGFKRLDDTGLAATSLCHFRPATANGQPEVSRSTVRYRFE